MSKFKEQLKLIEEGILRPMNQSEIEEVDKEEYQEMLIEIQKRLDMLSSNMIKNADGSYDVNDDVNLYNLKLLEEMPIKFNKVNGNFFCDRDKLTNLNGCPKYVGGSFFCNQNELTSLEGGPEKVESSYNCYNNHLTNLIGAPKYVGGDFICTLNNLTSLEGCPEEVKGSFLCYRNGIVFTKEDIRKVCKVGKSIHVD